ncbi:N-acetyltransferase family protein [Ornithinimicrobium sp. Y1847]|uniref:GNAT family N-acetyltransferase n=1 Tax=Ornithinimicrobium sp. Y1847 TaxID=3405419 RepID=UPI003B6860B4
MDFGEEQWDAARVAEHDERLADLGDLRLTTVALDPEGEPVAYTELTHDPQAPACATQDDTLVHGDHRGHGLGRRVKAANLARLREVAPTVRRVHTWNAVENTHMLAINADLGFRAMGAQGAWQLRR